MREERIIEMLNNKGIAAEITEVNKNGIIKRGITLGTGKVRPTVYIDSIPGSDEDICEKVIEIYNSNVDVTFDTESITSPEYVREHVVPFLCSSDIPDLVGTKCLDLNVYYRIIVNEDASYRVREEQLKTWEMTVDELHECALRNTKGTYGATNMFEMLMGLDPDLITDDFSSLEDVPMFVVTNESKRFGATALLHTELFKAIFNDLHENLYIIPSSIHELIVVPMSRMPIEEVNEMINAVNTTEVDPEEVLTNHVYIYKDGGITYET